MQAGPAFPRRLHLLLQLGCEAHGELAEFDAHRVPQPPPDPLYDPCPERFLLVQSHCTLWVV
jgi:hypothetical protein